MPAHENVFQDEVVRATDLNRGSGEVLTKAKIGPLTIIRNGESFALMRREVATRWRKEAGYAVSLTEIIWHALGHPSNVGPEYRWISAFDEEERQQLANELIEAYRKANRDGSWGNLEATLHEWSESGWAALDPELQEAFNAPAEEILLTPITAPAR